MECAYDGCDVTKTTVAVHWEWIWITDPRFDYPNFCSYNCLSHWALERAYEEQRGE